MSQHWKLKGDFVLSCNCTVFCCLTSLGRHESTEGDGLGRKWNFEGRSAELLQLDWGSDVC